MSASMDQAKRRPNKVRLSVPTRVRGVSSQNKFFDEETETRWVSEKWLVAPIHYLVDLEAEIHVTNLRNEMAGTFRVVWVNTRDNDGLYMTGLELLEAEGEMWGVRVPPAEPGDQETAAQAWLECRQCHARRQFSVPEAEEEYLSEGFLIARECNQCKGTTPWFFSSETAAESPPVGAPAKGRRDQRAKGRVPMKMKIKIERRKYGNVLEDLCETRDVSRKGVCFTSSQIYEVGETVQVVMPYKEGDVAVPVAGRVVRVDHPKEGTARTVRAVALKLEGQD
jgi:hypothetical protein